MKRLLLAGLLLTACAPLDPPTLVLEDESRSLNAAALETAAAPLLRHGNTVLVYLVNKGDLEGNDLARRLKDSNRLSQDHIRSHTVAIYASLKPRYSELRLGEPWSSGVTSRDLEEIRSRILNPGLRAQAMQQAYVDSLVRLGEKVDATAQRQHKARLVISVVLGLLSLPVLMFVAYLRWPQFALFRLLVWMWRQTPAGKAEARRQAEAQLKSHRKTVLDWGWVIERDRALIGWIPSDLESRLRSFDGQRKRLDQLDLAQAGELAEETRRLFQLVSELSAPWSSCRHSYQIAVEVLNGLRKALRPVKEKGKRKPPAEPCPELAEFETRLEQCRLDGKRERLSGEQLEELNVRQKELYQEISAFWKEKEPASWAARLQGSTSSTDSYASSYEPSSSTSSSSYDSNQDQSWSSGSSESRSGGEW